MQKKKHRLAVHLGLSMLVMVLATVAFAEPGKTTILQPVVSSASGDPDSPTPDPIVTKRLSEAGPSQDGFSKSSRRIWLRFGAVWMRVYLSGWLGR